MGFRVSGLSDWGSGPNRGLLRVAKASFRPDLGLRGCKGPNTPKPGGLW